MYSFTSLIILKVKRKHIIYLLLVLLAHGPVIQAAAQQELQLLHQLVGRWKMQTQKGEIWEQWELEKQQLKGVSFSVKSKDTTLLEDVILGMHNGKLSYAPHTSGDKEQSRVYFTLVKNTATQFEFENLQHDFPQRIVYHFIGTDSLHAWIEGPMDGKTHQQHYYYKRVQ